MKTTCKLLAKKCHGRVLPGSVIQKLGCEDQGGCPAVLENDNHMLVIGTLLSDADIKTMGINFEKGMVAVAISRDLLICAAKEIAASRRKAA
jgi:hypothetical protein